MNLHTQPSNPPTLTHFLSPSQTHQPPPSNPPVRCLFSLTSASFLSVNSATRALSLASSSRCFWFSAFRPEISRFNSSSLLPSSWEDPSKPFNLLPRSKFAAFAWQVLRVLRGFWGFFKWFLGFFWGFYEKLLWVFLVIFCEVFMSF